MEGYIFNILGDGTEELYYCSKMITEEHLKTSFENYLKSVTDYDGFENFYNEVNVNKIERIFIDEIYID